VRTGILPMMLKEMLETRVMIKKSAAKHKTRAGSKVID
jgi:DNA polymerase elongation subunit (family B)